MHYLPAEVLEPLPELAVTKAAPKPAVLVDLHAVFQVSNLAEEIEDLLTW